MDKISIENKTILLDTVEDIYKDVGKNNNRNDTNDKIYNQTKTILLELSEDTDLRNIKGIKNVK